MAGGSSKTYVPLLPAQPGQPRDVGRSHAPTKKRKASNACMECRRRKCKCKGPAPCDQCRKLGLKCEIVRIDGRSRPSAERAREIAENEMFLSTLLTAFRTMDVSKIEELVAMLRGGGSLNEIKRFLDVATVGEDLEYSDMEDVDDLEADNALPRKFLSMNELAGAPRFTVSAAPWTRMTTNDVASDLISLFFTWVYPFSRCVDQEIFLEAMQSGDLNTPFCSPLLVNSVLSIATHFSHNSKTSSAARGTAKGIRFYEETRRLWAKENGKASMTNFQALILLLTDSIFRGHETYSMLIWSEVEQMYEYMGFTRFKEPPVIMAQSEPEKMKRLWRDVGWNIYAVSVMHSLSSIKTHPLGKPASNLAEIRGPNARQDAWFPYPSVRAPRMVATDMIFFQRCHLADILQQFLSKIVVQQSLLDLAKVEEEFMGQMKVWKSGIPADLPFTQPLVDLILTYHLGMVAMADQFRIIRAKSGTLPAISKAPSQASGGVNAVQNIREVIPLLQTCRQQFGLSRLSPVVIQATSKFAMVMISALDDSLNQKALGELCLFVLSGARHVMICRDIAIGMRTTARRMAKSLPIEIEQMLTEFEQNKWTPENHLPMRKSMGMTNEEDVAMGEGNDTTATDNDPDEGTDSDEESDS